MLVLITHLHAVIMCIAMDLNRFSIFIFKLNKDYSILRNINFFFTFLMCCYNTSI